MILVPNSIEDVKKSCILSPKQRRGCSDRCYQRARFSSLMPTAISVSRDRSVIARITASGFASSTCSRTSVVVIQVLIITVAYLPIVYIINSSNMYFVLQKVRWFANLFVPDGQGSLKKTFFGLRKKKEPHKQWCFVI